MTKCVSQYTPYTTNDTSCYITYTTDKRRMERNQSILFGGLDDVAHSTDGGAPSNGGYYKIVIIDEPVIRGDMNNPDKIPSPKQWDEDMEILEDNLTRFNDNYAAIHQRQLPATETWIMMNDWGDHPLTLAVNKHLPIEEFMDYNFNNEFANLWGATEEYLNTWFDNDENITHLLTNNTQVKYTEEDDTLWVRQTKFANPNNWLEHNKLKLIRKIKLSLLTENMNSLAINMGYRHAGDAISESMLVYPKKVLDNIEYKTKEDLLKEGYNIKRVNYAWDIDTSRVLTLTPTIHFLKNKFNVSFTGDKTLSTVKQHKILIDKQIEIPAYGPGEYGELNDTYVRLIKKATEKHISQLGNGYLGKNNAIITIDDKRKWFLNEVRKLRPDGIKTFKTPQQHGHLFGIIQRQDTTILGLETHLVAIHPKNKSLVNDMRLCQKQDLNSSVRKTTGNTNYLDRIDSGEYGLEPFSPIIWRYNKYKRGK